MAKENNKNNNNIEKDVKQKILDKGFTASPKEIENYKNALLKARTEVEQKVAELGLKLTKKEVEEQVKLRVEAEKKISDEAKAYWLDYSSNIVNNLSSTMTQGVEKYFDTYLQYFSSLNTNLIGTGKSYTSVLDNITNGLKGVTSVSTASVLTNLSSLVESGISYNVEQRAFLQTVSDKIATTFDAANGTLTRLIRLSGNDLTQAYLGMESYLNEFLNSNFQDTYYLHSNLNESISSALSEAVSVMGPQLGTSFEYTIQKWLGSMSSVGVSDSFLSTIAEGINYLGSGNISALSSNDGLNSLLAVAANNAGLAYGDLMAGGLNSQTANQLMQGLYNVVYDIATSENIMVQNQYAQIFGIAMSDLVGIVQLSSDTIESISNTMYTYEDLNNRTLSELQLVQDRTSIKENIDNAMDNVMAGMAESIIQSGAGYITYMIADMLDESGLGNLQLPTGLIGGLAVGTIFSDVNIAQLLKGGIIGLSAVGEIGNILSMLTNSGNINLAAFGGTENNITRGEGIQLADLFTTGGITNATSTSTAIGTSDSNSILDGTSMALESQQIADNSTTTTTTSEEDLKGIKTSSENIYNWLNETLNSHLEDIKIKLSDLSLQGQLSQANGGF